MTRRTNTARMLLVLGLLLALFHAASTVAQMVPPNASRLLLQHNGLVSEALAVSGEVEIEVSGLLARTTVTQRFVNRSNDWAEGRYLFPLPDHAVVDALRIRIGERIFDGEVREREDATQVLAQARREGRSGGLLAQEFAGLYSITVTNIGPAETVEVTIAYDHRVEFDDGRFRLHFPTTLMPRYFNSPVPEPTAVGPGPTVAPQPSAPLADQPIGLPRSTPLRLRVVLTPGIEISAPVSLHHPVQLRREGARLVLELDDRHGARGRDFELEWAPAHPDRLQGALLMERMHDRMHALLMLVPPQDVRPRQQQRELILVIDRSGSMQGPAFDQARESLRLTLDRMRPSDHFNLIAFDHRAEALFETAQPATRFHLGQAYRFLDALSAAGGTEMDQALALATAAPEVPERLRQIVFATDGSIANEAQVLELVRRRIGSARLFTIGIGHGVNGAFLDRLARAGRGTMTRIADPLQVGDRIERLLRRLEAPVLTDLRIDWGVSAETWPDPLPDLHAGAPLLLSARLAVSADQLDRALLRVTGFRDLDYVEMDWPLDRFEFAPGVARAWAAARIDGLAALPPDAIDQQLRQDERLLTALDYRIVSDLTSLVAVDRTPRRSAEAVLARHVLAGDLPADRGPALVLAMPATDGGTLEALLRGISVLVIVLLMLLQRRLGRHEQAADRSRVDGEDNA